MGFRMGLLGKKVGMSHTFDAKGNRTPVTVLEVGPCVVLDIKTQERNGYSAVQFGFGEKKASSTTRPEAGQFSIAKTSPKSFVREVRMTEDEVQQFEVGQTVTLDQVFDAGDVVDVTGTSQGKGFQGVMKRHNFHGFKATHGVHETYRHGGSIGCRLTPGRVRKGQKMAGQMGNKRVTVQNISINEMLADKNLLLVKGAVPGATNGFVQVKHGIKRPDIPFTLRNTAPEPSGDEGSEDGEAANA